MALHPWRAAAHAPLQGLPVHDVLELFTSQGCSSCPPADRLFHSLARDPGLLALSLTVTIWDHLGWKDTLAKTAFSERQKNYGAMRGYRQIYTPQAVVNGVTHALGSDVKALDAARKDSRSLGPVLSLIPALERTDGRWSLSVPAGKTRAMLVLVTFQRSKSVEIARGENTGRTMKYGNVVRAITQVGEYTGAPLRMELDTSVDCTAEDGFALLVQEGDDRHPGAIIGAVESPRMKV